MRYIKLGSTDIDISVIGFGAWAIGGRWWGGTDIDDSLASIKTALENGINFIDTAPAYGKGLSEEIIGKALKGKREKVVLASKCGMVWHTQKNRLWVVYDEETNLYRNLTPKSIKHEIEQSLKRLKTDYIDLYQTHIQDPDTPISQTMETLNKLKEEGKIRAIGASNTTIDDLGQYRQYGQLDSVQEKYSILDLEVEKEILPWCGKNNSTFLAYSPLAQGLLTGRLDPKREFVGDDIRIGNPRFSPQNIKRINDILKEKVSPIADQKGSNLAGLALSWITSHENCVALCGARNSSQVLDNVRASETVLSPEEIEQIKGYFLT
jgi:methylglyoxal reductase